jgi:DNA helicase-2/ATP-dependent DNA helicase PcrA
MPNIDIILRAKLNPEQFAAATDIASEVLTLACAGSGKSRTLAYRIAWLIADREADPESIVAFTFTEKAADSIKLRVSQALTASGLDPNFLGRMFIGTIHSFCQYILGDIDARYRQFEILDENRLKLFLIENYPALNLHGLRSRARGNAYFETIAGAAQTWNLYNEELLSQVDVATHDAELGDFIAALEELLLEREFLDFSFMQRLAVEAMQSGNATAVVSRIQHLLVDEYQDINPIQDELIRQLHSSGGSLLVVGDDDQSIYGWRGADVTRIQTFQNRFPGTSTHTIGTNYRSTELIVRSADAMAHAELGANRIVKNPSAKPSSEPSEFRNLWFDDRTDEVSWVAQTIQSLIGARYVEDGGRVRGLTPSDFAILMRSTRQPEPNGHPPRHVAYTNALSAREVPFTLEAGGSLFDRPQVAVMRNAFELLRSGTPDRTKLSDFFSSEVQSAFSAADFNKLASVFSSWGRMIHAPITPGQPRRRVYPQNLVFDLLEAVGLAQSDFNDAVVQDLGVFSRIIQDVETVFPSVDSTGRFTSILNFLSVVAEKGYDTSSSEVLNRPNAVTVSTVHKMKGLEFPVVFVVDVEANRFPKSRSGYSGWIPAPLLRASLDRGAYQSTRDEEARLFYTALTRAERYLYVTGSALVPGGKRAFRASPFAGHLSDPNISTDPAAPLASNGCAQQQQRIEAVNFPTSFSDIKYYLRCPKDYQFRKVFGFSPAIPDLFGFGSTVHASIGKLHQEFENSVPTVADAERIAKENFNLKHVLPSRNPDTNPGPFERAKARATNLVRDYVDRFASDFAQSRQLEARFEIPAEGTVVSGAIDLMIEEDEQGNLVDACVVDFKTMEGGDDPAANNELEWTELALQVQLYAKAAVDILENVTEAGFVHLLKDGQRVEVPITDIALDAAISNIEWAVAGIVAQDFPMRPSRGKCDACDFKKICPMQPGNFSGRIAPPALHTPGQPGRKIVACFDDFDEHFAGL